MLGRSKNVDISKNAEISTNVRKLRAEWED
jgi:hypothetical protein